MGRTGRMLVGVTLFVAPGAAMAQNNAPLNYGDCISAAATGNFGAVTPQELAQTSAPLQRLLHSQGAPAEDGSYIGCSGFPPPALQP
jgi:hypothetical protein